MTLSRIFVGLRATQVEKFLICTKAITLKIFNTRIFNQRPSPQGSFIWSINLCYFKRLRYGSQDFQFKITINARSANATIINNNKLNEARNQKKYHVKLWPLSVTLALEVGMQVLRMTHRLIIVTFCDKYFQNPLIYEKSYGPDSKHIPFNRLC
jgi:hypothetical protein